MRAAAAYVERCGARALRAQRALQLDAEVEDVLTRAARGGLRGRRRWGSSRGSWRRAATRVAVEGFRGVLAALAGGWVDACCSRLIDIFMAFPGILLAIALAGVLGPGLNNVVLALCAVSWVGFARLARAQTLAVKARDHVLAARALGSPPRFVVTRHVLPLIAAPLLVEASFVLALSA